mgnify:FL=1
MRSTLTTLFIVFVLGGLLSGCATKKKLRLADDLYERGSYYNAVDYYQEVAEKKENNSRITYQLAESYRKMRDYQAAAKWYSKTLDLNENAWPEARYYYGEMLRSDGSFDVAATELDDFLDAYDAKDDKDDVGYVRKARVARDGALMADTLQDNEPTSEVEPLPEGVNSPLQDFAPHVVDTKSFLVSSMQQDAPFNHTEADSSGEDFYTMIYTVRKSGGIYEKVPVPGDVNDEKAHVGNAVLTDDGQTMFFTRCVATTMDDMDCSIYRSEMVNGAWGEPESVGALNDPEATTTQPALAKNDEGDHVLFFASDREGGQGGLDIWYSVLRNGTFAEPTNAGSDVNTPDDEVTPFYDKANGILYFSSTGHPGVGGFDIFMVEGMPGDWTSDVMNVGMQANSPADDLYLSLEDNGRAGYLVSNREGTTSPEMGATCCDDVFRVKLVRDIFLKGIFATRDNPDTPLNGVDVSFYKVLDGEDDFEYLSGLKTAGGESFVFQLEEGTSYKVNGDKEGYWPSITNLTEDEIASMEGDTLEKVFYIEPIERKSIVVRNIYFDFDKSSVADVYHEELDTVASILSRYPEFVVQIDGHTDNIGGEEYNLKLSERRAAEAAKYLMEEKEIDRERILEDGYGEERPIAPNSEEDGSDDPEGRQKNRRVEFKLLRDVPDESIEVIYEENDPKYIDETR